VIAGNAPHALGQFAIDTREMMFVQYLPIAMPRSTPEPGSGAWSNGTKVSIPRNVECFLPLIAAAFNDGMTSHDQYMYLTAKRLYVTPERMFNRPGWHIDGFGTGDLNYVWCDHAPTEFCVQPFDLSDDCDESMAEMEAQVLPENIRTYGAHTLLRLDNTVVHRPALSTAPGYRTFVKISISFDRYNLEGNAHNYGFDYDWPMLPRNAKRNHPSREVA
jgi:hypothetical protein